MKKVLATVAAIGLTVAAFGQGAINLDNSVGAAGGPTLDSAGNYYSGTYGLEVWYQNGSTIPGGINGVAPNSAYSALSAFTLATTITGKTITAANAGVFQLGQLNIPGVSPAGSSIVVALAMWNGSALSFTAAENAQIKGGVIAFVNPTSDYSSATPPPTPFLTGFGSDLVMTQLAPVPEPSTIALAGLGAAALLIFRRRN